MRIAAAAAVLLLVSPAAQAQTFSQRGFVEGRGFLFPQTTVNDTTRAIGDALLREEVFVAPARWPWIRFAAGLDLRANTHDQVEDRWRLDFMDRGTLRPRASVRRLTATITAGRFVFDVGKQFVRWARADVINPIDRFAPRDYLNVVDSEFLPVSGLRSSWQLGSETIEAMWTWKLTPSRMPLLVQRWSTVPDAAVSIRDAGSRFPSRGQVGLRWRHIGGRVELGLAVFDGLNHLPRIDVQPVEPDATAFEITRFFPRLRMYGLEAAVPTPWLTVKAEAAYFVPADDSMPRYGLYVLEVERQAGEWLLTAGYAGEGGRRSTPLQVFDPERDIAPAFLGRASYTVDPQRTVAVEWVMRQNGDGQYVKGDFSQAIAQRWRATVTGVLLAGDENDFLGQFNRNSHMSVALRLGF